MGHKKHNIRKMQLIQSTKSEREKLDETIKSHMQELDLNDQIFESPLKNQNSRDRFGYILLNPLGDLVLQKDDILYIIKPESSLSESRPTSSFSEPSMKAQSCEDLLGDTSDEKINNNMLYIRENEILRRHSVHAIDEEEVSCLRIEVPKIPLIKLDRSATSPV